MGKRDMPAAERIAENPPEEELGPTGRSLSDKQIKAIQRRQTVKNQRLAAEKAARSTKKEKAKKSKKVEKPKVKKEKISMSAEMKELLADGGVEARDLNGDPMVFKVEVIDNVPSDYNEKYFTAKENESLNSNSEMKAFKIVKLLASEKTTLSKGLVFNTRLTGLPEIRKAMKKHFTFDKQYQSFGGKYYTKKEMEAMMEIKRREDNQERAKRKQNQRKNRR